MPEYWLIEELRELGGWVAIAAFVVLWMGIDYLLRTRRCPRNAPHIKQDDAVAAVKTRLTAPEEARAKTVALLAAVAVGIILVVALKVWVL